MSIAGIEGLELADEERLLWDRHGMLRWHRRAMSSAENFAEEDQGLPSSQPRKQGDLFTTEVTEPQNLVSSDVLSVQVPSLEGILWSHLCLDPIFQRV